MVGAGVVGLSTAYHIKRLSPGSRVVVVERNPGPGMGDTSKSAAMFRVFFTSRTNLLLAKSSVEFYESLERSGWDLGMRYTGYLFLVSGEEMQRVRRAAEEAEKLGGSYRVVEREELSRSGIRVDLSGDGEAEAMGLPSIELGIFVPRAGSLDPEALVGFYERSFRSLEGEVLYNVEVKRIILGPRSPLGIPGEPFAWQEIEAKGVETSSGLIEARNLVVAAGSWSRRLLEPAGIDPLSNPKKRQLFVIRASSGGLRELLYTKGFNDLGVLPFTILPRGVYVKPEPREQSFWTGLSDDLGRPYGLEEDPRPEEEFYRYSINPVLSMYMPQFANAQPHSMWAGYYDMNPVDGQPVIFKVSNIEVVAGTSGSGIMKADAIGRIASSLALDLEEAELFGGHVMSTRALGLRWRSVEPEGLIL